MNCDAVREWLRRDLDGSGEPWAEAANHLLACPKCAAEAERLQRVAEAARAALPGAEVPEGFADRVLAAVVPPTADDALERASRPRVRWLLVALAMVLAPGVALLLFPHRPIAARGALLVERDGAWVAAAGVDDGGEFALAGGNFAEVGPVKITALSPAVLRGLTLLAGAVALETRSPATIETRAGTIRLHENTRCLAVIAGKEDLEMVSLDGIRRSARAAVAVAVLAGGATVANAQGEGEAREREVIVMAPDEAPRHMEEILKRLHAMEERLAELEGQGARGQGGVFHPGTRAPGFHEVPVSPSGVGGGAGGAIEFRGREAPNAFPLGEMLERARRGDAHAREHLLAVAEEIRRAVHGDEAKGGHEELIAHVRMRARAEEVRAKELAANHAHLAELARKLALDVAHREKAIAHLRGKIVGPDGAVEAGAVLLQDGDELMRRIADSEDELALAKKEGAEQKIQRERAVLAKLYGLLDARREVAKLRAAMEEAAKAGKEHEAAEYAHKIAAMEKGMAQSEK